MKKTILIALLAAASMNVAAQSSDAAYPEGTFINELPAEESERPYAVDINVKRVTEKNPDRDGRVNCGYISVTDNKTEKVIYEGDLKYHGKGLKGGVGNGIYYFNVILSDGQMDRIGLRKDDKLNLEIVSLTGPLGNHPFLKEKLFLAPLNGSWTPATIEVFTEKQLLKNLHDAQDDYDKDRIEYRTRGYGNVQQYIKAHTGLNPNLPKYAKPKGSSAINIREQADASAAKMSELAPGQSLLVVDEYNGWCQVKLGTSKYGWVSLGVVTLSNNAGTAQTSTQTTTNSTLQPVGKQSSTDSTQQPVGKPSTQTAAKPAAATSFVLGNGKLGPLSVGQTVASLPKSVAGLYDNYKVTKEEHGDEEGTWMEEWVHFYKGGKEIFKAFVDDNKKLSSFALQPGSSFIKTTEGYYVGYNARELFNKKRMEWTNYYTGTAFARSGHFEFHINDDDLDGADIPSKASHIKASAKISEIIYYQEE